MVDRKTSVLLVEDNRNGSTFWDRVLAEIQDDHLEFLHLQQIAAVDAAVRVKLPDVIILDLSAPEEDRLKLYLSVRQSAREVPIIVVTEDHDRSLVYQTLQEGAQDWLAKEKSDGAYSLSRSMHYAIWNQFYLKQLRTFSQIVEQIGIHQRKDLMPLARQQFAMANTTRETLVHLSRLSLLAELDARLAKTPEEVDAFYYRSRLLMDMGRTQEGRAAYFNLLQRVSGTGSEAAGHAALGDLLREKGDEKNARVEYDMALKLNPDGVEAKRGLTLLASTVEKNAGLSPQGDAPGVELVPVILLISAMDNNDLFQRMLDPHIFQVTSIVVEFYDPSRNLPPHRLIINGIGDADICGASLKTARAILARSKALVINAPAAVLVTGRFNNAIRLGRIPGVITPAMLNLSKEVLTGPNPHETIAAHGFSYPFLLRSPGFHTGRYFQMIAHERNLAVAAASLPGDYLLVIRYLDARGADGKFRKYRVVFIDGKLYPAHLAVSRQWKNHYFNADMADYPEHRAEDEAFLKNFRDVIGERALRAIEMIRDQLSLDYAGVDFGLDADRNVLLFEANTGMTVNPPDPDPRWNYRREPLARILNAARQMLLERAKKTRG